MERGNQNKIGLKWEAALAAIWYIKHSLSLRLSVATAKFPQILRRCRCLLHVKQRRLAMFLFNAVTPPPPHHAHTQRISAAEWIRQFQQRGRKQGV